MSEERILQVIAERVEDDRLHFQVIIQNDTLHVYINRDTEEYLNYSQLTNTIRDAIATLEELNLVAMGLHSRVLGEVEPDWQTFVELADETASREAVESMVNEINSAVKNTESLIDQIEELETSSCEQEEEAVQSDPSKTTPSQDTPESTFNSPQADELDRSEDKESVVADFSQYCFTRNKGLLNAELVAPHKNIAQIVETFDKFETSIKRSQLPLLEGYFKRSQEPDLSDFDPEIQTWWTEISSLDSNAKRKLAIWLSRYCLNPEDTIATIENVFVSQAAAKKVTEAETIQKAKEEREARNSAYLKSLNSSDFKKSDPKKSPYNLSFWIVSVTSSLFVIAIRPVVKPFIDHLCCSDRPTLQQEAEVANSQIATQHSQSKSSQAKQLTGSGLKKYHQQDFNGALEDLTSAIELYLADSDRIIDSGLEKAYNLRGLVRQELHDYYGAIEDANKTIELSPYNSEYYAHRGLAYLGARDYQAAIADETHAIKLKPKNSYWYFYRGKAYHEAGDYNKALADLDLAITLNYFTIEAYEQRYYTHRALGNLEQAEADYQKAKYFGQEPQK